MPYEPKFHLVQRGELFYAISDDVTLGPYLDAGGAAKAVRDFTYEAKYEPVLQEVCRSRG